MKKIIFICLIFLGLSIFNIMPVSAGCDIVWTGDLSGSVPTQETSKTEQAVYEAYTAIFGAAPGWCGNYLIPPLGETYYFCSMLDPNSTFPFPPGKIVRPDGSWDTYTESGNFDLSGNWDVVCEPTLVELASLDASPGNGKVTIRWTTAAEIDNAGLNLYRSESENGQYIRINVSLIPAKGSSTQGDNYEFVDTNVLNRRTYYYKLEDIDVSGTSTMHGPVKATPRLIFGFRD